MDIHGHSWTLPRGAARRPLADRRAAAPVRPPQAIDPAGFFVILELYIAIFIDVFRRRKMSMFVPPNGTFWDKTGHLWTFLDIGKGIARTWARTSDRGHPGGKRA
jgi:hypothetical protein